MNLLEKFHADLTAKDKPSEENNVDIDAIADKVVEKLLNSEKSTEETNEETNESEE